MTHSWSTTFQGYQSNISKWLSTATSTITPLPSQFACCDGFGVTEPHGLGGMCMSPGKFTQRALVSTFSVKVGRITITIMSIQDKVKIRLGGFNSGGSIFERSKSGKGGD